MAFAFLIGLLACEGGGGSPGPEPDGGIDTSARDTGTPDSGSDTGTPDTGAPDTGRDTGEDTGVDTHDTAGGDTSAGDSGGDSASGDSAGTCTADALVFEAEVRDATGAVGVTFTTADELTMAGVIRNPCGADVSFAIGCGDHLLSQMSVGGVSITEGCDERPTTWIVPAGGAIEETYAFGRAPFAGAYTLSVTFRQSGRTASVPFTITP